MTREVRVGSCVSMMVSLVVNLLVCCKRADMACVLAGKDGSSDA